MSSGLAGWFRSGNQVSSSLLDNDLSSLRVETDSIAFFQSGGNAKYISNCWQSIFASNDGPVRQSSAHLGNQPGCHAEQWCHPWIDDRYDQNVTAANPAPILHRSDDADRSHDLSPTDGNPAEDSLRSHNGGCVHGSDHTIPILNCVWNADRGVTIPLDPPSLNHPFPIPHSSG